MLASYPGYLGAGLASPAPREPGYVRTRLGICAHQMRAGDAIHPVLWSWVCGLWDCDLGFSMALVLLVTVICYLCVVYSSLCQQTFNVLCNYTSSWCWQATALWLACMCITYFEFNYYQITVLLHSIHSIVAILYVAVQSVWTCSIKWGLIDFSKSSCCLDIMSLY